ncbi:hypothetical protein Ancab_013086 [Ancistrocladus abbreviatus]
MAHRRQQTQRGQLLTGQFICRMCNYRTVDVDEFRSHRANHMPQASSTFHERYAMRNQQQNQRNVFFNPFYNQLPPSYPYFTLTTTSASSRSGYLRQQQNLRHSMSRGRTQLLAQDVPHHARTARTRREEWTDLFTRPLIDQLDRPLPIIIDLVEDEDDFGPGNVDLTLHL